MIKFLMTSLLVRVAAVQATLLVGGLWFVAHNFSPDATFETATGQLRHVFLSTPFIAKMLGVYFLVLPVAYVLTRFVVFVTAPVEPEEPNRARARSAGRRV
jgi:hypothetical protein